jgi:hypothetical protein
MVPTLEIIHPDLPGAKMIINEADYDPTVHQLYGEPSSPDEPRKRKRHTAPTSPPAEDLLPEGVDPETPAPEELALEGLPPEDLIPEVVDPTSLSQEDPAFEQLPPEEPTPTYSQSDLEAKNITALRAIAAEKRIPRRMKLSRDELIEAILGGVGNGE